MCGERTDSLRPALEQREKRTVGTRALETVEALAILANTKTRAGRTSAHERIRRYRPRPRITPDEASVCTRAYADVGKIACPTLFYASVRARPQECRVRQAFCDRQPHLENSSSQICAKVIALNHQERGTAEAIRPVRATAIPLWGGIFAVADVVDAATASGIQT